MEVYNFLKQQCCGETPYYELGACILEEFFSAHTLAKKLLYTLILRTSPEKHKEVKEVLRIAKVGWNMTAAGLPDGEEKKCLLAGWSDRDLTSDISDDVISADVTMTSS